MIGSGVIAGSRRRSGLILPQFRSGSGRGVASAATSIPITKPTGLTAGDMMICACMANNASGTYDPPEVEWQHILGSPEGIGCATFWKIADADDVAATSFTFGRTTNTAGAAVGILLAYSQCTATPEEVEHTSGSGTAITLGEVLDVDAPTAVLVHIVSKVTGTSGAFDAPPGAAVTRMPSQNTGGTLIQFIVADETIGAGDTGDKAYTYTGSSASRGALVVLPAA